MKSLVIELRADVDEAQQPIEGRAQAKGISSS
jgi:hypothetical protein